MSLLGGEIGLYMRVPGNDHVLLPLSGAETPWCWRKDDLTFASRCVIVGHDSETGYFADVVVFDPKTVADHATFVKPQQYATGVSDVLVNGQPVLQAGEPTGAPAGRVVRGRGWTGWKDGGCRKSARDWTW